MKSYHGVYYFPSYAAAKAYAVANQHPTNRIIQYGRGWAIQLRVSGPYVGHVDVPYVEVDKETAYGSTVRLSRSVRVF